MFIWLLLQRKCYQHINNSRASILGKFILEFPLFSNTNSLYWGFTIYNTVITGSLIYRITAFSGGSSLPKKNYITFHVWATPQFWKINFCQKKCGLYKCKHSNICCFTYAVFPYLYSTYLILEKFFTVRWHIMHISPVPWLWHSLDQVLCNDVLNPHIVLCTLYSVPAPCDMLYTAVLYWSCPTDVQANPLLHLQTLDRTENKEQNLWIKLQDLCAILEFVTVTFSVRTLFIYLFIYLHLRPPYTWSECI
jgi:hypothetical protein